MKATPSAEPFYGLDAGGVTSLEGGVAGLENIDPYSKSAAIGTQATIGAYSAKKIARAKAKKARSTTRKKVNAASAAIATTAITAMTAASDADAVDDDEEGRSRSVSCRKVSHRQQDPGLLRCDVRSTRGSLRGVAATV